MPIGRFRNWLIREKRETQYLELLHETFNPKTVDGLMCRHQISVGWDGSLYDCDFNLALSLPVDSNAPTHVRDFDIERLKRREIITGEHCFGCTAGCGSSCAGSLV